jgi:hypothetical protein
MKTPKNAKKTNLDRIARDYLSVNRRRATAESIREAVEMLCEDNGLERILDEIRSGALEPKQVSCFMYEDGSIDLEGETADETDGETEVEAVVTDARKLEIVNGLLASELTSAEMRERAAASRVEQLSRTLVNAATDIGNKAANYLTVDVYTDAVDSRARDLADAIRDLTEARERRKMLVALGRSRRYFESQAAAK